jgi:NAD(P)-dependent dehydrogenase (short-subunit alcohol dehydrogenase family)
MEPIQGRTAIVTGATAGIGRALAGHFAREGVKLVLSGRREDRLREVVAATGGVAVAGDVTDRDVRDKIVAACEGRADILVNNAGYGEPGPVETVPEAEYRRQMEVNLFAGAELIRSVLPLMRRQRWGRIVNVSSVAGRFGYPLFGWYCASKHALEGLSDALRLEAAPWGIRVVLVEPGPVRTEFFDVAKGRAAPQMGTGSPYAPFFAHIDEIEADFMRHATTPERVAEVIVKACRSPRPKDRYAVTAMAKVLILLTRLLPRRWFDAGTRKQFRVPGPSEVR